MIEPELQFPAAPDSRGWTWHCVLMFDMYELHWRTWEVRSIRAKAAAIDLKGLPYIFTQVRSTLGSMLTRMRSQKR